MRTLSKKSRTLRSSEIRSERSKIRANQSLALVIFYFAVVLCLCYVFLVPFFPSSCLITQPFILVVSGRGDNMPF